MADNNKKDNMAKEVGQKVKDMTDQFGKGRANNDNNARHEEGDTNSSGNKDSGSIKVTKGYESKGNESDKDGQKGSNHFDKHDDSNKDMKDSHHNVNGDENSKKDSEHSVKSHDGSAMKRGEQGSNHYNQHNSDDKNMKDNESSMKDSGDAMKDSVQHGYMGKYQSYYSDEDRAARLGHKDSLKDGTMDDMGNDEDNSKGKNKEGEEKEHPVTLKELFSECMAQKYILASENELEGAENPKDYLTEKFKAKFLVTALEADSMPEVKDDCQDAVKGVLEKANNMIDHCLEHFVEKELNQDAEAHSKTLEKMGYEEGNESLLQFFENANNVLKEVGIEGDAKNILLEKVVGVSFEASHNSGGDEGEDIEVPGDGGETPGEGENGAAMYNDINSGNQLI